MLTCVRMLTFSVWLAPPNRCRGDTLSRVSCVMGYLRVSRNSEPRGPGRPTGRYWNVTMQARPNGGSSSGTRAFAGTQHGAFHANVQTWPLQGHGDGIQQK